MVTRPARAAQPSASQFDSWRSGFTDKSTLISNGSSAGVPHSASKLARRRPAAGPSIEQRTLHQAGAVHQLELSTSWSCPPAGVRTHAASHSTRCRIAVQGGATREARPDPTPGAVTLIQNRTPGAVTLTQNRTRGAVEMTYSACVAISEGDSRSFTKANTQPSDARAAT